MTRLFALLAAFVLACGLLAACTPASSSVDSSGWGEMEAFTYHFGGFHEGYWFYDLQEENGRLYLTATGANGVELDVHKQVPPEVLTDLTNLVFTHGIDQWDGFAEDEPDVQDGYGFVLQMQFANHEFKAGGHEREPENYFPAHEALAAYLEELAA